MGEATDAPKPGDEKPLHVRVAEALGWTRLEMDGHVYRHDHENARALYVGESWRGRCPEADREPGCECRGSHCYATVPRYDTDWAATGPLISRHKIRLSYSSQGRAFADHPSVDSEDQREGERDILPAVCRLILALHAAGKLPEAR